MSKVQTVEAIPVSYPEPNDFNALRHLCLVKITTDDGVVGWGESITQFPEANFAVKAIIEGMAERVVGKDPLDNIAIWHSLQATRRGGTATAAASPRTPSPPSTSRCGTSRASSSDVQRPATCSAGRSTSGCRRSPRATPTTRTSAAMVEEAQEWVAPGLHGVKVGFGKRGNARLGYEHDRDVEYIRADARGPRARQADS